MARMYPERYGSIVILDNSATPSMIEAAKAELAQRILHRLLQEGVMTFNVETDVPRFNDDGTATPVTIITAGIDVWPDTAGIDVWPDDDDNPDVPEITFFDDNHADKDVRTMHADSNG